MSSKQTKQNQNESKPKRPLSQKQKEALEYGRARRAENLAKGLTNSRATYEEISEMRKLTPKSFADGEVTYIANGLKKLRARNIIKTEQKRAEALKKNLERDCL